MGSTQPGAIASAAPGQTLPVVNPPPAGSNGSIYQNGNALTQQSTDKLGDINKLASGGRSSRRRRRRTRGRKSRMNRRFSKKRRSVRRRKGGAINVAVPQTSYPQQGTGDQTIEGITTSATKVGTSTSANGVYDQCIGQPASCTTTSGGRRRKIGGNVKWGCMSGGKKKTSKGKKSKGRKIKKSRKFGK